MDIHLMTAWKIWIYETDHWNSCKFGFVRE